MGAPELGAPGAVFRLRDAPAIPTARAPATARPPRINGRFEPSEVSPAPLSSPLDGAAVTAAAVVGAVDAVDAVEAVAAAPSDAPGF